MPEFKTDPFNLDIESLKLAADFNARLLRDALGITKESRRINAELSKTVRAVKTISDTATRINSNLRLSQIVRQVDDIQRTVLATAKSVQKFTGANLKEWQKLNTGLINATKKMNAEMGKGVFNSKDLLRAANALASIGWSDLASLSDLAPAVAQMSKAVGTVSNSLNKSIMTLYRVFKDGTDNIVKSMSNSITAFSKLQGVTSDQLQNAAATLSARLTRMAGGSTDRYASLQSELFKAVATAEQMGFGADKASALIEKIMGASASELSSYAQAFGIAGLNVYEVQSRMLRGDISGAMNDMLTGISRVSASGTSYQQNLLFGLMSSIGLTNSEFLTVGNNLNNLADYVDQANIQGDLIGEDLKKISEYTMSVGEQLSNWFSGSSFMESMSQTLTALGLGSITEISQKLSSFSMILSTRVSGDRTLLESFMKTQTIGASLDNMNKAQLTTLLKDMGIKWAPQRAASLYKQDAATRVTQLSELMKEAGLKSTSSQSFTDSTKVVTKQSFDFSAIFKSLGKIALYAAVAAVALRVLSRVMQNDKVKKAFASLMKVAEDLVSIFMSIVDAIGDALGDIIGSLVPIVEKLLVSLTPILQMILDLVKGPVVDLIKTISNLVVNALNNLVEPITDFIGIVMNLIKSVIGPIVTVTQIFVKLLDGILKVLMPIINVLTKVVGVGLQVVINVVGSILNMVSTIFEGLMPVTEVVFGFIETFLDALAPILNTVGNMLIKILDNLTPILTLIVKMMIPALLPLIWLFEAIDSFIKTATGWLDKIKKKFKDWLDPLFSKIHSFFNPIFNAIKSGINSFVDWLAGLHIGSWHPFGSLKGSSGQAPNSGISQDDLNKNLLEITNATTAGTFASTAIGGLTVPMKSFGYGLTSQGFHTGEDIPVSSGTPLSASQLGLVLDKGYNNTYGNYLSILGSDGITRLFGHLNGSKVDSGDYVLPGQYIADTGNTGDSLLPHIHYETSLNRRFIDPKSVSQVHSNADIVNAIREMTERIENKLEEVSAQTESNSEWIREFDLKQKSKKLLGV